MFYKWQKNIYKKIYYLKRMCRSSTMNWFYRLEENTITIILPYNCYKRWNFSRSEMIRFDWNEMRD